MFELKIKDGKGKTLIHGIDTGASLANMVTEWTELHPDATVEIKPAPKDAKPKRIT